MNPFAAFLEMCLWCHQHCHCFAVFQFGHLQLGHQLVSKSITSSQTSHTVTREKKNGAPKIETRMNRGKEYGSFMHVPASNFRRGNSLPLLQTRLLESTLYMFLGFKSVIIAKQLSCQVAALHASWYCDLRSRANELLLVAKQPQKRTTKKPQ